jgi:hypothetical protein
VVNNAGRDQERTRVVEERRVDPHRAPAHAEVDSLSSHPDQRRSLRRGNALALVCVVALVVAGSAVALRNRHSDWPTGCGVEGHQDWCTKPSRAMTDAALTRMVRDYCPGLSASDPEDVVPRPLDLADLGGRGAYAKTSGTRTSGSEDSLLGRGRTFSWVTRWSGGPEDGVVEVRCPGRSRSVPSLRLDEDQYRSSVAAARGQAGYVDFARLAETSVRRVPGRFGVSFGFLTCDTAGLDLLRALPVGRTFGCRVEVYTRLGKGGDQMTYRVTADPPYFVREAGGG